MNASSVINACTAFALVATAFAPLAAAEKQEWRYLVDYTPLVQLHAEYQAALMQKVYVADENQEASKALAAPFDWSVAFIAWDTEGYRFQTGCGQIVWNDETFGTGIVTAAHVLRNPTTGQPHAQLAILLSNDLFTAIADEDNLIPIELPDDLEDWRYPGLDLAVVPLDGVLLDEIGEPIEPVSFYQGPSAEIDEVLIGGYGRTGPIEIAGQGSVPGSIFDGFRRAARATFDFFPGSRPGVALLKYDASVVIPGISGSGDSGGFACIEQDGVGGAPHLWGVIITGSGTGVNESTGVTYLGPDQQDWIHSMRRANVDLLGDADGDGIPNYIEMGIVLSQ